MRTQEKEWNDSYERRENFVFYPHEEVIRFFSKHIRKRVGLDAFQDIVPFTVPPKILDLGCGIGRHIIYAHSMGAEAYGIDLSRSAIKVAWDWAQKEDLSDFREKIKQGDIRTLPYPQSYFDFVLSHGVLDSMPFETAREAVAEVSRVLKTEGLFYCDVISGDDSLHYREFDKEEIVQTEHEKGTIQSYFNFRKITSMINQLFHIAECIIVKRESVISSQSNSRYHLVLRKI